jgi:hypothetical protein
MDTQTYRQTHNIDGDRVTMQTSDAQFKDAMRYRKIREFLDTLVIMDKDKGAMHFENSDDLDEYIDKWRKSRSLLTPAEITTHALKILEGQLTMTIKENRK